jgi:two-component system alkaline phosphatase synthesis response regulator PhoP
VTEGLMGDGNEQSVMKKKILLVDDEPDIVETVEYVLQREGYEVLTATDGYAALGVARVHKPDLLLLDVMLPGENGYRVSRAVRDDEELGVYPRRVPIVLVTARDLSLDPEREKMFMEFSRADLVIYKPFDLDEMLNLIQRLLKNADKQEETRNDSTDQPEIQDPTV